MKRDVLFLCQFFYPEYNSSATLPFDTARYLAQRGYSVGSLCGYPKEYSAGGQVPIREAKDGVSIRRLRYMQLSRRSRLGRLINYFSFTLSVLLHLFEIRNYRAVIVYASTATLYILRQADSANASDASSDFSLALKVVNDCTYLLKSHTVLDEVISSLNLDMEYEDLYDCVSTSNPEDTRILEVTVKADSPELAKRIVDRICTIGSQRIEDAMGFQQVNLYELGTTDPNPCNSTRMITFAFAGIVAAVMVYVFFLIIFLLDDRIKADDENLERYLGLSVLGNIPNADGKKAGKYGYYKTYAAYKAPAKQEVEDK